MRYVAILSLVISLANSVRCQDEASDLLIKGKVCLDAQQADKAIEYFTRAILLKPDLAGAYSLRASAYLNTGQFQKAIDDCSSLIALRPDALEGYLIRGFAYVSLKEWDRAGSDLSKAIEMRPEVIDGYSVRAVAYASLKEYERSIHDCSHAIDLSPEEAFFYFLRATSEFNLKRYDEAIIDLKRAVALAPGRADCAVWLGSAYAEEGHYDSALTWARAAVGDTALSGTAYYNMGLYHLASQNPDDAIACFTASIERDTTHQRWRSMLGLAAAFYDRKELEEARSWFRRAQSVEPKLELRKDALSRFGEDELFVDAEKRTYQKVLEGL